MPGGQEPSKKKRKRGDRREKEKPLLAVQGLLRLDHCFVAPTNEEAETITVQKDGKEETLIMAPGTERSEHDMVAYKAGYDTGPTNPLPQDEREEVIFAKKKIVDDAKEYFDEMKKETEETRKEREEKWKDKELSEQEKEDKAETRRLKREAKKKKKLEESEAMPEIDPMAYGYAQDGNPDNPANYLLPENENVNVFGEFSKDQASKKDSSPAKVSKKDSPPAKNHIESEPSKNKDKLTDLVEGPIKPPGEEDDLDADMEVSHEEGDTRMVVVGEGNDKDGKEGPKDMPSMTSQGQTQGMFADDVVEENVVDMAMAVALEMEEKRRKEEIEKLEDEVKVKAAEQLQKEADELAREAERSELSLDELTTLRQLEAKIGVGFGTSTEGPMIHSAAMAEGIEKGQYDQRAVLDSYWEFVRENPQDFNGWVYLIQTSETVDLLDEIRTVYNAFLPLFPYCYAYWKRYSDIERKSENWQRALAILHRGLEAIPLSVDLWDGYLELYHKMYQTHEDFDTLFRTQCEKAVAVAGLEYRSDLLWEHFIEWEVERKNLRFVTTIFRRVIAIPTKLYNKHWDNFIAHVRDHHPRDILEYEEYDTLRRLTCKELQLTYRPDPVMFPDLPRKVELPEDKLKAGMKERMVASLVTTHEAAETKVDKIYMFEEKLKRTYFHVKPLDQKQLKTWDQYLDFEIERGDYERTVVLFERCLIPCALYEQFWAKYARYLEKSHREKKDVATRMEETVDKNGVKKARFAFNTGLDKVDELRERRTTWTMKGWKVDKEDEEGNKIQVMVAEEIPEKSKEEESKAEEEKGEPSDKTEDETTNKTDDDKAEDEATEKMEDSEVCHQNGKAESEDNSGFPAVPMDSELSHSGDNVENGESVNDDTNDERNVEREMMSVVNSSAWLEKRGWEAVRDVYKRACIVHCPRKAVIRMKWASFEENVGNVDEARDILRQLVAKYPMLLEARMQQLDLERRDKKFEVAEKMYLKLMKQIPSKHEKYKNMKTWIAMKYARFQFKICANPDKALAALRSALKKERGNPRLYSQIIDVCYQRHPVDVTGVTASIELALVSKELTSMQKLEFVRRKVEFMQEFGDVGRYRDAWDQLKMFRQLCSSDLKVEAKRKKELEAEEKRMQELEEMRAQANAEANMKAKIAEAEGRLVCVKCQSGMLPNAQGVYEFENFRLPVGGAAPAGHNHHIPDLMDVAEQHGGLADDAVIDLMDFNMDPDEEEKIRKSLVEKTKYKEVAPTWELNIEQYGYGAKRRAYDPDYEHVESSKYREFERLEANGYDEDIKDKDDNRKRNIKAPGLGHKPGQYTPGEKKYTTSDYIIPPKVPQITLTGAAMPPGDKTKKPPGETEEHEEHPFELPRELADPQVSPCVNVPEWFVREGGELCLSETGNGMSVIRYWPKFLSEKGNDLMMTRLRRYCKWHQKQVKVEGEWKYQPRLVSWYGPCDYSYSGLTMEKNLNWAPELLDLLHRLISMTRHEFNSCFLNLYRHGYDMCGWHSDSHPQLGRNPPVASVSLGAVRVFELRKKQGAPNFIRFPLFPGSLLLMEGAVQEDWLHCLPKDPACKEERVNLTFRIMYSGEGGTF